MPLGGFEVCGVYVSSGMGGGFCVVIITEGCSSILWAGAKKNVQNSVHNKELSHQMPLVPPLRNILILKVQISRFKEDASFKILLATSDRIPNSNLHKYTRKFISCLWVRHKTLSFYPSALPSSLPAPNLDKLFILGKMNAGSPRLISPQL